jgi:hypothetical protein
MSKEGRTNHALPDLSVHVRPARSILSKRRACAVLPFSEDGMPAAGTLLDESFKFLIALPDWGSGSEDNLVRRTIITNAKT